MSPLHLIVPNFLFVFRSRVAFSVLLWLSAFVLGSRSALPEDRGFTVRDSIEMVTFSEPSQIYGSSEATSSPDGRYYAIVTSRGLIEANKVESTLWIFRRDAILQQIQAGASVNSASPRPIARVSVKPVRNAIVPYQAVISEVRWSADSNSLYYLGQNSGGARQLYQTRIADGHTTPLSGADSDVRRYDFAAGTVVYLSVPMPAHDTTTASLPGLPINEDASNVTNLPLEGILFPQNIPHPATPELWTVHEGRRRHITNPLLLPDLAGTWDALSISPDGRKVVLLIPTLVIDPSWETYTTATDFESRKIYADNSKSVSPINPFRLKQYAVFDLSTGSTEFVVNAPYGIALAYQDVIQPIWSKHSNILFLTNTFLPTADKKQSGTTTDDRPCSVASLNLARRHLDCVVHTRDDIRESAMVPHPKRLKGLSVDDTGTAITLILEWPQTKMAIEHYQFVGNHWRFQPIPDTVDEADRSHIEVASTRGHPLRVEIRQGLNTPPTLWGIDGTTGEAKQLWDPNPQLRSVRFGAVSVYRWKDQTGYPWSGGLVLPVGYVPGKRYPLVIQTHGFRDKQFMTDGEFPTAMAAQPMASAGIVVLQVGGRSEHVFQAQEAVDQVDGYSAAIKQLEEDGIVDSSRVGIIGFSRTYWYVETALINTPHTYVAATLADGVDENYLQYMMFPEHLASEAEKIHLGRPFGEHFSGWLASTPAANYDRIQASVRIEAITPQSVLGAWELFSSLRLQGKPVDLVYLPHGQHILQTPLDRLASQQGNVDWFRFWLQGYEDHQPAKKDQYRHWEEIRTRLSNSTGGTIFPIHQ